MEPRRAHHREPHPRYSRRRDSAISSLRCPAVKLLRDAFPDARIEILGYKHIVALAEMSGYADATRSIEYGPLASFFSREGELRQSWSNTSAAFSRSSVISSIRMKFSPPI